MSSTLNKIHVTNSTGLSLNERFTAISSQPKVVTNIGNARRSRSRSRSVQRQLPIVKNEHVSSRANQRLLAQLQRKHKMHAALKLKRRSMRTVGGGGGGGASNGSGANGRIQRGSVKAFRVGANGKPIRANSFARVATMKADNELLRNRNVPLRRTNSSGNIANRLGPRRPTAGGAAQRVAKRKVERQLGRGRGNGGGNGRLTAAGVNVSRGRSRSRSRTRVQPANERSRSRSRTRNVDNQNNNRNRSRNRNPNDATNAPVRRGRSRSRTRGRGGIINKVKATLPVKARLGVRPGQNNSRRNASLSRRGVQTGRVEKRRNSTNAARAAVGNNNNGRGRPRSRSAVRNATNNSNVRPRTRSRTRKGQVGQQRQQGTGQQQQQQQKQQQPQQRNNRAPRGRSQQRRGSNGKGQTQPRRGRSRSRTGRGANGGNRNQGNKPSAATKTTVNKDELDKELDQYMATTKTENEMDYLLKN